MPRQKTKVPVRPFNLSLPKPLYEQYVERSQQWAEAGKNVSVTALLVRAAGQYITQEPWWEDPF